MKAFVIFFLLLTQTSFACEIKEIRKDLFSHFKSSIPISSPMGEHAGISTLKEIALTDTMMRLRGEDFFITKLVFDILWTNGMREEKEILMAAVIDMAGCRIESFESGDIMGASISTR